MIIGEQLRYATDVIDAWRNTADLGGEDIARRVELANQITRVVMQVIVSIAVLVGGFFLLQNSDETLRKLASGLIGTVVGYWLR